MPTLSICIPTYGRSEMLRTLLDSIGRYPDDRVDVVVSDDASPDDTVEVVQAMAERMPVQVSLIRQPTNIGFESNFLAVVAAAGGEYVCLMGDDDAIEGEGIRTILAALDSNPSCAGLTLGAGDYDPSMTVKIGQAPLPPPGPFHGADEMLVRLADSVGFMSTLVVRRDLWLKAVEAIGRANLIAAYPQVQIVAYMLQNYNPLWVGVPAVCIRYRTGNDHLLAKHGWDRRIRIDVQGYRDIRRTGISTAAAGRRFEGRIIDAHLRSRLVNARTGGVGVLAALTLLPYLCQHYWNIPAFWRTLVPLILAPSTVLRGARRVYRALPGLSASARARATV